ncbi:MAG: porin family protein [Planctomycetes bacterium]|nr:porin family protein [Planctomycetota bacterium]
MKRSLVTIIMMLALATTASASVETGDVDLNLGFSWQSENGVNGAGDRTVTDLQAGVDYFVTNRISLGASIGYYNRDQSSNAATNKQTENSFGLRIKYYILKKERLLPYVGLAYKFYNVESKLNNITSSTDDTGTTFLAGLRYSITQTNAAYLELQMNRYGDKWPNNVDGGTRVLIGLIHQLK